MTPRAWTRDFSEAMQFAWTCLRTFWTEDIWPLLMTVWIFLVMAAPIIVVILVLWYLDSIGYRASPGFYSIG